MAVKPDSGRRSSRVATVPTGDAALAGTSVSTRTLPDTGSPPGDRSRRFSVSTFDSFSVDSFRWFFVSMSTWFASMNMQMVARGVIAYDLTNSYAALGVVSLANAIPGMVLSLPGGVLADRMDRQRIVQAGQVSNMVMSAVLAALLLAGVLEFWHLLASAVFQGSTNALVMPARQSMIPDIVPENRLMNAVALNAAAMNMMRLIAPATGGLMMAAVGAGWVFVTMAMMYGLGSLCMFRVHPLQEEERASSVDDEEFVRHRGGSLHDIIEGCKYMRRDKTVLLILTISLMIVLFSQPFQIMLAGFTKDVLGVGSGGLGILMSVMGLGSLVGSLIIASLPERNRGGMLLISSLVLGVGLLLFAVSSWFWLSLIIVVIIGLGQAGRMSLSNVLLQSYTEKEYRGRVMSVYMMEFSLTAFGTFFVGLLASAVGIQAAIGSTALVLVVLMLATLVFAPRMRRLA